MSTLKLERLKKGIRIENIARELKVTRQYIYLIERGDASPNPIQAKRICDMIGCDFGKLELYNRFPTSYRLDIRDYINISRNMGFPTDLQNIFV